MKRQFDRLSTSWFAGVAVAASILVPLRLDVFARIAEAASFKAAIGDYLLVSGVGYFAGVFVTLPLLIIAAWVLSQVQTPVQAAPGRWSVIAALLIASTGTLVLHLTPLAAALSQGMSLRLSIHETFAFFLICSGVSALAFQVYDIVFPPTGGADDEGRDSTTIQDAAPVQPIPVLRSIRHAREFKERLAQAA